MKSILFRSIGVSLFLLCLTFSSFAEGEMGAGSLTDNGRVLTPDATVQINAKTDDSMDESETGFLKWIAEIFADVLS